MKHFPHSIAVTFSLLFLGGSFATIASYAQQEASSEENFSAGHEDTSALDKELEFLNSQDAEPVQEGGHHAPVDASGDTLTEGLKSLFSSGNENTPAAEEGIIPNDGSMTINGSLTDHAILQGLNKVTARTSTLEAALNDPIAFGTLEITVHKCWKAAPEEMQENKVLMEIWDQKPGEEKSRIFYGWMFSSTPSLSALENPVYDVTVVECKNASAKEKTAR